jgi:hypothetical protein
MAVPMWVCGNWTLGELVQDIPFLHSKTLGRMPESQSRQLMVAVTGHNGQLRDVDMAYWTLILSPAITNVNGAPQHERASVVGPMTAQQYTAKYGSPDNTINPANGFVTRLQAQNAANRFNAQSAKQRETPGSAPNAPNAAKVPGTDLLHGFNWGNWILRIGEILLGAVLIGVGVAKLTGADNLISTALKVVK